MAVKKTPPFKIEREDSPAPLTIRLTAEERRLLDALVAKLEARSANEVIRHAIRWLAEQSGLK